VAGDGARVGTRRPLGEAHDVAELPRAAERAGLGARAPVAAAAAQVRDQGPPQRAAGLHIERLVDRFVREMHLGLGGIGPV